MQKLKPDIHKGRKHDKGYIWLDGVLVAKVKIPNDHDRLMHQSKSKYIAEDLKLTDSEFNQLNDCTLTGPGYYTKLRSQQLQE